MASLSLRVIFIISLMTLLLINISASRLTVTSYSFFVDAGTVAFRRNVSFAPDDVTTKNDQTKITAFENGYTVLRSIDQKLMITHDPSGRELWKWNYTTTIPQSIIDGSPSTKEDLININFNTANIYLSPRTDRILSCSASFVECRNLTTGVPLWYKYIGVESDPALADYVCRRETTVLSDNHALFIVLLPPTIFAINILDPQGANAWNENYASSPHFGCLLTGVGNEYNTAVQLVPATFSPLYPDMTSSQSATNGDNNENVKSSSSNTMTNNNNNNKKKKKQNRKRFAERLSLSETSTTTSTSSYDHALFHDTFVAIQGQLSSLFDPVAVLASHMCIFNAKTGNLTTILATTHIESTALEMIDKTLSSFSAPASKKESGFFRYYASPVGQKGVFYFLYVLADLPIFCGLYASNGDMRFCVQSQYGAKRTDVIDLSVSPFHSFATLFRSTPIYTIEVFYVDNKDIETRTVSTTWFQNRVYLTSGKPFLCLDSILMPGTPSAVNIPKGDSVVGMSDHIRSVGFSNPAELWSLTLSFSFEASSTSPKGNQLGSHFLFADYAFDCRVETTSQAVQTNSNNNNNNNNNVTNNNTSSSSFIIQRDLYKTQHQSAFVILDKQSEVLSAFDLTEAELKPRFRIPLTQEFSEEGFRAPMSTVHGAGTGGVVISFDSVPNIVAASLTSGITVFRRAISSPISPFSYRHPLSFGVYESDEQIFIAASLQDGNMTLFSLRDGSPLTSTSDETSNRRTGGVTPSSLPLSNVVLLEPVKNLEVAVAGACKSEIWTWEYANGANFLFHVQFDFNKTAAAASSSQGNNNTEQIHQIVPAADDYCISRALPGLDSASLFLEFYYNPDESNNSSSSSSSSQQFPDFIIGRTKVLTNNDNTGWYSTLAQGFCNGPFSSAAATTADYGAGTDKQNTIDNLACVFNETHLMFLWIENGTVMLATPFSQPRDETTQIEVLSYDNNSESSSSSSPPLPNVTKKTITVAENPSSPPMYSADGTIVVSFKYGIASYELATSSIDDSLQLTRSWLHVFQPSEQDAQVTLRSSSSSSPSRSRTSPFEINTNNNNENNNNNNNQRREYGEQMLLTPRSEFSHVVPDANPPKMMLALASNSGRVVGFSVQSGAVLFEYNAIPFKGDPMTDGHTLALMASSSIVAFEVPSPILGDFCFSANSNTWSVLSDPAQSDIIRIIHPINRRYYYRSAQQKAILNLDNLVIPTAENNARFFSMFDPKLGVQVPFSIGSEVSEVDYSETSQTISVRGTKATVDLQKPTQDDDSVLAWSNMVSKKRRKQQEQNNNNNNNNGRAFDSAASAIAGATCPSVPICPSLIINPMINFHHYIDNVAVGALIESRVKSLLNLAQLQATSGGGGAGGNSGGAAASSSINGYLSFDLQSILTKLVPSKFDENTLGGSIFGFKSYSVIWQSDTSNTIWGTGFASVNVPLKLLRITRRKSEKQQQDNNDNNNNQQGNSGNTCSSILDVPMFCSSFEANTVIKNATNSLSSLPTCSPSQFTDFVSRWMFIVGSCDQEEIKSSRAIYSSSNNNNNKAANLLEELTFEYNCKLWINKKTGMPYIDTDVDDDEETSTPIPNNNNNNQTNNNETSSSSSYIDIGQLRLENSRITFQCTEDGRVLGWLSTSLAFDGSSTSNNNQGDDDENSNERAKSFMQGPFILVVNQSAAPTFSAYPFNIFSAAPSFSLTTVTEQTGDETSGSTTAQALNSGSKTAREVASLVASFSAASEAGMFGRSDVLAPEFLTQLLISDPDNELSQQFLFVEPFLGVQFACTTCSPYFEYGSTAQPTVFLVLGAIKTMFLLVLSYKFQERYGLRIRQVIGRIIRLVVRATALAEWQKDAHAQFAQMLEKEFYPPSLTQKEVQAKLSKWLPELDEKNLDPSIKTPHSEFSNYFCVTMSIDGQRMIKDPEDEVFLLAAEKENNNNSGTNKTTLADLKDQVDKNSKDYDNDCNQDDDNDTMIEDSSSSLSQMATQRLLGNSSRSGNNNDHEDDGENDTVLVSGGTKSGDEMIRKALKETFDSFADAYHKIGFANALYDSNTVSYISDELELEEEEEQKNGTNNNSHNRGARKSYREREMEKYSALESLGTASELDTQVDPTEDRERINIINIPAAAATYGDDEITINNKTNDDKNKNNEQPTSSTADGNNKNAMTDELQKEASNPSISLSVSNGSIDDTTTSNMNSKNNNNSSLRRESLSSSSIGGGMRRQSSSSASLATSTNNNSTSRFQTAGYKLKKKQLEAVKTIQHKQSILSDILDEHPEWCTKVHISDLPTRANDSLLPVKFMVQLGIVYTLFILFSSTYEVTKKRQSENSFSSGTEKGSSSSFSSVFDGSNPVLQEAWFGYQTIYFHVTNAGVTSATIVSAAARQLLLRRPQFSDKVALILSILIVLPAICSHCIPAMVVYGWIYVPLILISFYVRRRIFRQRAILGTTPYSYRVISRALVFLLASWIISSSYNLACIYIYRSSNGSYVPQGVSSIEKGDAAFYMEALGLEWNSRSVVCAVNNFARSFSMLLRNLGTLGPVLS